MANVEKEGLRGLYISVGLGDAPTYGYLLLGSLVTLGLEVKCHPFVSWATYWPSSLL